MSRLQLGRIALLPGALRRRWRRLWRLFLDDFARATALGRLWRSFLGLFCHHLAWATALGWFCWRFLGHLRRSLAGSATGLGGRHFLDVHVRHFFSFLFFFHVAMSWKMMLNDQSAPLRFTIWPVEVMSWNLRFLRVLPPQTK